MRYCDTEKGRSMIETIGYMGVFMVLVAGIGRLVSGVFDDYKYSKASLQLGDLAAAITRAASVDGDYTDVVSRKEWENFVPKTFRKKNGEYYHAFNGKMVVRCLPSGCSKFEIIYNELNKKQCVELAMKDWGKNKTVSLDVMQIRGSGDLDYVWCWHDDCAKKFPVQRYQVEGVNGENDAACGNDADAEEENKQIIWIFN